MAVALNLEKYPIDESISPVFDTALNLFTTHYYQMPTHASVAPGRVNLIGEHTDYNDGFVCPMALQKSTVIVGTLAGDGKWAVICDAFPGEKVEWSEPPNQLKPCTKPKWANYVKGVVAIFERMSGMVIPPFHIAIASSVPMGGGVSSSAALEISTATFIEAILDTKVDPADKARWGQLCEHEFVGLPCGIMDQMISSRAVENFALLIDCRSMDCKPVSMNDPNVAVVVANSNVSHELTGSEYPERRDACFRAAKVLGIKALRDADMNLLNSCKDKMDDITYRRARHVITENERTEKAATAFASNDFVSAGKLMVESHNSLRNDYEVSIPEIDLLVDIALRTEGVYGSRITGGGFGGCTVTLVKESAVETLLANLDAEYSEKIGKSPSCFVTKPGRGARVLSI